MNHVGAREQSSDDVREKQANPASIQVVDEDQPCALGLAHELDHADGLVVVEVMQEQ